VSTATYVSPSTLDTSVLNFHIAGAPTVTREQFKQAIEIGLANADLVRTRDHADWLRLVGEMATYTLVRIFNLYDFRCPLATLGIDGSLGDIDWGFIRSFDDALGSVTPYGGGRSFKGGLVRVLD
jgi:hypothetical protein